jgi:hypothetical protein
MLWTALAAPLGTLAGSILHEASHAVAAELLGGDVVGVGWRGGWRGGPYIEWMPPYESVSMARLVGIAPVITALIVAGLVSIVPPNSLSGWLGVGGLLVGLLLISPADVDPEIARQTPAE